MKLKKTDYIALLVLIATFVQLIIVYPSLPEQVVTNWGFDGEVSYAGKSTLWILWGMNALLLPLFFVIPKIDPKGKSYAKVDTFYTTFRLVMILFLAGMLEITILSANDPHRFDVGKIAMIALSLLLMFMGNYMPKCKQSFTFGIKNMWTLSDERVWNETHRLGGIIFFVAGVLMLVSTFIFTEKLNYIITMVIVFGSVIITSVYSYLLYRKYNP